MQGPDCEFVAVEASLGLLSEGPGCGALVARSLPRSACSLAPVASPSRCCCTAFVIGIEGAWCHRKLYSSRDKLRLNPERTHGWSVCIFVGNWIVAPALCLPPDPVSFFLGQNFGPSRRPPPIIAKGRFTTADQI
jgi:hypothetical protein